jgi:hypothetical protein
MATIISGSTGIDKVQNDAVDIADLSATGTASASTFLCGNNSWTAALPTQSGNAGKFLTTDASTASWATVSIPAGGITDASQWRVTTSFVGEVSPIASNLEVVDTDGYGSLGSAMTESSGVFTFPSTGYWLIEFTAEFYYAGDSRYNSAIIETTTDDSSYGTAANSSASIVQVNSTPHANAKASFLFDVTNTSTHKVRFTVQMAASASVYASTSVNLTHMTFIRLGDT